MNDEKEKYYSAEDFPEIIYKPLTYKLDQNILRPNGGKKKDKCFLYFSVFTTCLMLISSGSAFIWTSPMLPILRSNDTNINPIGEPVTPYQESLLAGLVSFGSMAGSLAFGKLADVFGRKNMLILFSTLQLASFVTIALGNNIHYYYTPRFLQGVAFGFSITILPLFIAEITEDHNRGKFGSFTGLFIILGNLYGFAIGPLFNLQIYTLFCAAPLVLNIICFALFIPESPIYLASTGNRRKAKSSLKKFRDVNSTEAEKCLLEIERMLRKSSETNNGCKNICKVPGLRNGLIISVGLNIIQQASGICAILGFVGPVFESARLGLSGNASGILVGVMQLCSVIFSSIFIEKLGRRMLLLISTLLSFLSLFFLGLYFYLKSVSFNNIDSIFWLPVVCIVIFVIGYAFGLGPVPAVIMSEIFPNDFKSVAASISICSSGITSFVAVFCFPLISVYLGVHYCFWIFSGICCVSIVFVYFVVPETKGKSFLEIQKILNR